MAFEEIDGVILNPVKLREQCALIAQNYDYENASYVLLLDCVNQLCREDSLRGSAITGFKSQMSNYESVFDALCYANELDKYDINVLNSVLDSELGNDILDGTEILGKIAQAEKDYESYLRQKDYWYSEYMDASWHEIVYSDLCYYTYKYYEKLANDAAEDKAYWEGRGELLISISEELSGLFILGNEFRDCTKKGICQINTAFDVNTNTYLIGDMSWKDELQNRLVASVYTEAGRIDWNLVEQILAKDADAISDTEYILVAYAYMKADVDEFSNFFMMCRVPEEVDSFEFANLYLEHKLDVMSFATMRMMTLDPKKIDAICRQVNIYQTNLLALIRYGNLDESSESSLIIERNDVIQRITVARELNEIHSFWGYQEDNFFDFEYCDEGFGPYESVRVTYNSFAEAHELEPASIMTLKMRMNEQSIWKSLLRNALMLMLNI